MTAATVLDDVVEASLSPAPAPAESRSTPAVTSPRESAWFVRLTSTSLSENDTAALLSSLGIRLRRVSHVDARCGSHSHWLLTYPCSRVHLDAALDLLSAKTGSHAWRIPVLE